MNLTLPDCLIGDLIATFAFVMLAVILMIIGYKLFDKATPQLDFNGEIHKGNIAMAVVVGSIIIGIAFVIAKVASAILGGAA